MSAARTATLYIAFAAVATAVNVGTQALVLPERPDTRDTVLALVLGTAVGLPTKYVLDKRWIFRFEARDAGHEAGVFLRYCALALVTTAIFWGCAALGDLATESGTGNLVGSVVGLAIGYASKYHLDRRFAFTTGATA